MKKYYCIPITNSNVFHNGQSLKDHLMIVDYPIYIRDVSFKEFFYGRIYCDIPTNQELDKIFQEEQKYMKTAFKEKGLPESLIAVSDDEGFYEITTKEKLNTRSKLIESMYRITEEDAIKYLDENPNYIENVNHFFNLYYNKERKTSVIHQEENSKKEENNKAKKLLFTKNKNKNK